MNREQFSDYTVDIFQQFMRVLTANQDFIVNLTSNDRVTLEKFLNYIDEKYRMESVGVDFLINFMELQFQFYYKRELKYGISSIGFNWIIGKRAIGRYEKIKNIDFKTGWSRHSRKIRKDINLKILHKYNKKTHGDQQKITEFLKYNEIEEIEKKRFYNVEEGFVWCVTNTTLYNHISNSCLFCKFKQNCKETLKINYPNLYKKRGYETS